MELALDDGATQDFKSAALVRRRRDVQWLIRVAHDILTGNRPFSPPRPPPRPKATRVFRDWLHMASAHPCRCRGAPGGRASRRLALSRLLRSRPRRRIAASPPRP